MQVQVDGKAPGWRLRRRMAQFAGGGGQGIKTSALSHGEAVVTLSGRSGSD